MDAGRFLTALFGECPSGLWFYLWTLPDKRSEWFEVENVAKAAEYAERTRGKLRDCYVGVALGSERGMPVQRIKAEATAGIVGLWADVDIADPAHKKPNLPPTIEDARGLVESMGVPPSIIVHSGHGLHAWWLFQEPWVFEGEEDRKSAMAASQSWNDQLRQKARPRGWDVDATHDLARVLRVPGTLNCKAVR
jgi:putative DNA primase/helicase